MYDVMQGVRVVEVAEHTFVPAAAMILADWGADVIKIERPGQRGRRGPHDAGRPAAGPAGESVLRGGQPGQARASAST